MEAIEEEIETLSLAIKSEDKVLAMPTGATYATFPFWDTSITAR